MSSSGGGHAHAHAAASAAAATAGDASQSPADRLARLMQRHALTPVTVAQQLAWPLEQLDAYLVTRRNVLTLDRADNAVESLLERYRVAAARQALAHAPLKPLAPIRNATRRTCAPTQFPRHTSDAKSVISSAPTQSLGSAAAAAAASSASSSPTNRKRKRRVESKQLASDVTAPVRVKSPSDVVCPIRIDVDVNGTRFQDTLLLNVSSSAASPEVIADQIARDERLCEDAKDAIAESIRRQLTTFTAFVGADAGVAESLHPIYLDLIIDGFALRDQFEWDISREFADVQAFASTLCADLKLSPQFESAVVFSVCEQVAAYRQALHAHRWLGNDPTKRKLASRTATAPSGYIEVLAPPTVDQVERDEDDAVVWQPALSELSKEERQFLSTRLAAARRPTSVKKPPVPPPPPASSNGQDAKRAAQRKDQRMPRPLNAFIMYCQVQKDAFNKLKPRRSASESRKVMGDQWRRMTDEEKESYTQLAERENEKRRREHIFELRDRAIAEWEEEEARRRGLLGSSELDTTTEHTRGVLLA
ncbi:hypothetical protein PybrP1_002394, partial [[Pythium] brassicae (nom. inval.)]